MHAGMRVFRALLPGPTAGQRSKGLVSAKILVRGPKSRPPRGRDQGSHRHGSLALLSQRDGAYAPYQVGARRKVGKRRNVWRDEVLYCRELDELVGVSPGLRHLGRANVTLSVTLTATSTLLALGTMPVLTAAGITLVLQEPLQVAASVGRMVGQLVLMMLLPLGLGMALRAWRPARIAVARGPLRGFSLAALGCLAALILVDRRHGIVAGVAPRSPSRCRSAC